MAITSEVIGKLGGADVEVTPVEGSISGQGKSLLLHTVEVSAGERVLVAISCLGELAENWSTKPYVSVGTVQIPQVDLTRILAVEVVDATSNVRFHSVSSGTSSFTGHVYVVKL